MKILLAASLFFVSICGYAQTGPPSAQDIRGAIAGEIKSFNIPAQDIFKVVDKIVITGRDSVKIRIYYPNNKLKLPLIYNIHGGALVAGDLDTHENICRVLANRTQAIVIALDYHKPPEFPYPASLNDTYYVLNWIIKNANTIGFNKDQITLLGDSGGGLLASALILKLANQKEGIKFKNLVLINPAEDLRNPGEGMYGLVTQWYLGKSDPNDPLVSPMTAGDVSYFPPSLIIVCQNDELKPHGENFNKKLISAGAKSTLITIPNEGHLGGLWAAAHPKAIQAINNVSDFINTTK